MSPPSSGWLLATWCFRAWLILLLWRKHVPPKRPLSFNGPDGVIFQKTVRTCNSYVPEQLNELPYGTPSLARRYIFTGSKCYRAKSVNTHFMSRTPYPFEILTLISEKARSVTLWLNLFSSTRECAHGLITGAVTTCKGNVKKSIQHRDFDIHNNEWGKQIHDSLNARHRETCDLISVPTCCAWELRQEIAGQWLQDVTYCNTRPIITHRHPARHIAITGLDHIHCAFC
jgi:hypothetical protein